MPQMTDEHDGDGTLKVREVQADPAVRLNEVLSYLQYSYNGSFRGTAVFEIPASPVNPHTLFYIQCKPGKPVDTGYGPPPGGKYDVWTKMSRDDFFYLYSGEYGVLELVNMVQSGRVQTRTWLQCVTLRNFAASFSYATPTWIAFFRGKGGREGDVERLMAGQWHRAQKKGQVVNDKGEIVAKTSVPPEDLTRLLKEGERYLTIGVKPIPVLPQDGVEVVASSGGVEEEESKVPGVAVELPMADTPGGGAPQASSGSEVVLPLVPLPASSGSVEEGGEEGSDPLPSEVVGIGEEGGLPAAVAGEINPPNKSTTDEEGKIPPLASAPEEMEVGSMGSWEGKVVSGEEPQGGEVETPQGTPPNGEDEKADMVGAGPSIGDLSVIEEPPVGTLDDSPTASEVLLEGEMGLEEDMSTSTPSTPSTPSTTPPALPLLPLTPSEEVNALTMLLPQLLSLPPLSSTASLPSPHDPTSRFPSLLLSSFLHSNSPSLAHFTPPPLDYDALELSVGALASKVVALGGIQSEVSALERRLEGEEEEGRGPGQHPSPPSHPPLSVVGSASSAMGRFFSGAGAAITHYATLPTNLSALASLKKRKAEAEAALAPAIDTLTTTLMALEGRYEEGVVASAPSHLATALAIASFPPRPLGTAIHMHLIKCGLLSRGGTHTTITLGGLLAARNAHLCRLLPPVAVREEGGGALGESERGALALASRPPSSPTTTSSTHTTSENSTSVRSSSTPTHTSAITTTVTTSITTTVTTTITEFPPIWVHVARVSGEGCRVSGSNNVCNASPGSSISSSNTLSPTAPHPLAPALGLVSEERKREWGGLSRAAASLSSLFEFSSEGERFKAFNAPLLPPLTPPLHMMRSLECAVGEPPFTTLPTMYETAGLTATSHPPIPASLHAPLRWLLGGRGHPLLPLSTLPSALHPGLFWCPFILPPPGLQPPQGGMFASLLSPLAAGVLSRWGQGLDTSTSTSTTSMGGGAALTLPSLAAETLLFCVGKPLASFPRATPVTLGAVEVEEGEGRLVRMALLPLWRRKRLLLSGAAPGDGDGGGGPLPPTRPDVYDSFGSGLFLRTARARLACSGAAGRGVGVGVAVEGGVRGGAPNPPPPTSEPSDKLSSALKTWVSRGSNILRVYAKARPMDIYMADKDAVENGEGAGEGGGTTLNP